MIRRSRLIKVIFGSSAVIFILLQFLESSVTSSPSSGGSSGSTTLPSKLIISKQNLTKEAPAINKTAQEVNNFSVLNFGNDYLKIDVTF